MHKYRLNLFRSSLTCVVIRNVGNVPLTIKSLEFNEDFIKQISENNRAAFMNKKHISVDIFPGKMWVLCLGAATHEIMKYETKILHIDYTYSEINRKHIYKENIDIDFEQYKNCNIKNKECHIWNIQIGKEKAACFI